MLAISHVIACILPGQEQDAPSLCDTALKRAHAMGAPCTVLYLTGPSPARARVGKMESAFVAAQARGAAVHHVIVKAESSQALLEAVGPWLSAAQRAVLLLQKQSEPFLGGGSISGRLAALCADRMPHVRVSVVAREARGASKRLWAWVADERLLVWREMVQILLICTLACELMQGYVETANLVAVYMAGTAAVALRNGMRPAVVFVLAAVLLYDFIFLPPYWTLIKLRPDSYLTFGVMMALGCLISHLASNLRRKTREVEERARRAQARNELSYDLARATDARDVQAALGSALAGSLDAAGELLLPEPGGVRAVGRPEPQIANLAAACEALASGADVVSGAEPAVLHLVLRGPDSPLGVLAVRMDQPPQPGSGDGDLLRAFADKAAIVLQRQRVEVQSTRVKMDAEAERIRSTLLAAISHDFRSPMTTIVGSISSLLEQRDAIDAVRRDQLLRGVLNEAQRVHHLMNNLLELTRIEGGVVQPRLEWCPVDELFAVARMAQGERLSGYRLETEFDPEALLWCDPLLMEQVLGNLLDNARHHAPNGSRIQLIFQSHPRSARLIVKDDGPGFPPGREQDMVMKFTHGAGRGSGTGLGLAICAAIAKLHDGSLAVANEGGACVNVWLPQPDHSHITQDTFA